MSCIIVIVGVGIDATSRDDIDEKYSGPHPALAHGRGHGPGPAWPMARTFGPDTMGSGPLVWPRFGIVHWALGHGPWALFSGPRALQGWALGLQ